MRFQVAVLLAYVYLLQACLCETHQQLLCLNAILRIMEKQQQNSCAPRQITRNVAAPYPYPKQTDEGPVLNVITRQLPSGLEYVINPPVYRGRLLKTELIFEMPASKFAEAQNQSTSESNTDSDTSSSESESESDCGCSDVEE